MTEFLMPVVVLGLVFTGVILVNYLSSITPEEVKRESCSLHDWIYDQNEKMLCMQCGYRPGDNQ